MEETKTAAGVITAPEKTYYRGWDIALGGTYSIGAFNIAAMVQALYIGAYGFTAGAPPHSPGADKSSEGELIAFNLIPAYDFDFGTVGMSFIFQTKAARIDNNDVEDKSSAWTRFGMGAWYKKGLAGGSIKAGVAYAFPMIQENKDNPKGFNGKGILSIPIIFEYAFF
jgi:hypothetical protein